MPRAYDPIVPEAIVSPRTLAEAVRTYNVYRSPMATAELVDASDGRFTVRFQGPFCRMCCDYDYFEDLIYELDALSVDIGAVDIHSITQEEPETYVVEYYSAL